MAGNEIARFQLSPEYAKVAIARADELLECRAFAKIIKNLVNPGGILVDGASFIKNGEN
jgi:hypothetical protein